ncbi:MAG TPA: hypothetical protein VMS73_01495 [Anaerolineaceae bacterium]|nr:hypothetical protein [Anaerolineaceae bacterium]
METKSDTIKVSPPRLVASIIAGFNTVAAHAYLIIFPIILDLMVWLGPHVRVKAILQPFAASFIKYLTDSGMMDSQDVIKTVKVFIQSILDQFNMLGWLRTWPVGVPSLLANAGSMQTPVGGPSIIELPNLISAFLSFILVFLIGTLFGSLFFNSISNASLGLKKPFSIRLSLWQFEQSVLLSILLVILAVLISFPISIILSIVILVNAGLAEIVLLAIGFLLIWFLLPLVFSAHGIFLFRLNTVLSIATSVRLVRFFLPGTGLFLVMAYLLNEGMNLLWRMPSSNSWMTFVGVAGHAFIASGLLAGSFIYYGNGMRWMQENLQRVARPAANV